MLTDETSPGISWVELDHLIVLAHFNKAPQPRIMVYHLTSSRDLWSIPSKTLWKKVLFCVLQRSGKEQRHNSTRMTPASLHISTRAAGLELNTRAPCSMPHAQLRPTWWYYGLKGFSRKEDKIGVTYIRGNRRLQKWWARMGLGGLLWRSKVKPPNRTWNGKTSRWRYVCRLWCTSCHVMSCKIY